LLILSETGGKMDYENYLRTKKKSVTPVGFDVEIGELNPELKDFQSAIVQWALRRGRAALFCDTGLGKTFMQLEWANHVFRHTGMPVLVFAPLAVTKQTAMEAEKFGIKTPCKVVSCQSECIVGINITNYDKMHHFENEHFGGLVLDESSILKSFGGKIRKALNEFSRPIRYRLACTATPAPNDYVELTNHSEFLDIATGKEVIARFFTQEGNSVVEWRLRRHAVSDFWNFVSQWAIAIRKPSDIGYSDAGYNLPEPVYHEHVVPSPVKSGLLFPMEARTMTERRRARRDSIEARCDMVADIVSKEPDSQWLIWCDLNDESSMLKSSIPDSVDVKGSDKNEYKEKNLIGFKTGLPKHLISKPSICGHGMNWQHCARMAFVGLSDSFEQMYQARRRIWRFGQTQTVHIHVVTAESEGAVVANIKRKEKQMDEMFEQIKQNMEGNELFQKAKRSEMEYNVKKEIGNGYTVYNGDSCEVLKEIKSDSIGMSVFSPPFPGMYVYTDSSRDIGNAMSSGEVLEHMEHLTPELHRVLMPGRSVLVHITQERMFQNRHGHIGIYDFRGDYIRHMTKHGFHFVSEKFIDKDPQLRAVRSRDHGLAMKTIAKDSSKVTGTMPDILLQFRKEGDNPRPIKALIDHPSDPNLHNPDGWITADEWIQWASAVWYGYHRIKKGGIRETDVLNVQAARETNDERHLCPLQLGVIERCVKLWSAPGDTVLSPFMGIGSEGYVSLKHGRKFVGVELKPSYFEVAVNNLNNVKGSNLDLFENNGCATEGE
jgi:DNA modification methylase